MRENQQECQQQMIEILEKVSEQVKKVENIHSGSMPSLDGEYYTPPVSQVKGKLSEQAECSSKFAYIFGARTSA